MTNYATVQRFGHPSSKYRYINKFKKSIHPTPLFFQKNESFFTHFTFLQCQNHQFEELLLFFLACLSANVPVHARSVSPIR